jgi:hypothetical protein
MTINLYNCLQFSHSYVMMMLIQLDYIYVADYPNKTVMQIIVACKSLFLFRLVKQ